MWIVAALTLAAVLPLTAGAGAKALLGASALSVGAPMVLAVFWAAGRGAPSLVVHLYVSGNEKCTLVGSRAPLRRSVTA